MQVLSALPPQDDERLLVSARGFDDAGVARLSEDVALVQSVDFFPPVVDDPWWFGRIAAANALSDLYAMGARPFSALNIVAFPREALPLEVLTRILEGGADATREAGALLLGGHSVDDEGLKFGLAVTGTVRPGEQWTNAGARAGDALFLTKPLGTGCITTAAGRGKADAAQLDAAMRSMGRLNRDAAEALATVADAVHAVTDVTGFGLAGHAAEMAEGSDVTIVFAVGALPLLDGALALMARGFASGGAARTRDHLGARLAVDTDVDAVDASLAVDAETSGGLLVAVAVEAVDRVSEALAARQVPAVRIGRCEPREGEVRVRLVRALDELG